MTRKINCWEYMGCGREPGGCHAADKGICPAATDRSHDGTNEGTCGGRFCWAVAGTLCHNQVQGTYAGKQESCLDCEFYLQVRAEQGSANIIKVYDITSRYKTVFIACEYLIGLSLEEMIDRQQRILPDLARIFLDQLLSAMAYAGKKGLVHRDINPANIMVSEDHQIKLIDFGLACPVGTDDFLMGGNLHYLAPEMFDGEPADFRSDIFSLGITAFHMITGHLPWDAKDSAEIMKQIRHTPLPDPGKQVKNLPGTLRQFILKACEKDPDFRFQTPEEARQKLADTVDFGPAPVPGSGPVLLPGRYCCMSTGQHETRDVLPGSHMDIGAATHIGRHRKTNQDRYLACLETQSHPRGRDFALLALADGLGGAIGGEIAADHVIQHLQGLALQDDDSPLDSLKQFYMKMDRDICGMAETDPYLNGMGTTLTCAVVIDNTVFWSHSGDSRLYHILHENHLTLISRDQTLADFLLQEKEITPDQARTHYSQKVLEQYIGCGQLAPQSGRFELAGNDMILLMSDGCYRHVSSNTIIKTCRRAADPPAAADALVKQALTEDGTDNITVVALTVRTGG
jgi:serine/threonine protein phosphatase PrpC